jgi:hypothetical protein
MNPKVQAVAFFLHPAEQANFSGIAQNDSNLHDRDSSPPQA